MYRALRELFSYLPVLESNVLTLNDRPSFTGKIEFIDELKRFYENFEIIVIVRTHD